MTTRSPSFRPESTSTLSPSLRPSRYLAQQRLVAAAQDVETGQFAATHDGAGWHRDSGGAAALLLAIQTRANMPGVTPTRSPDRSRRTCEVCVLASTVGNTCVRTVAGHCAAAWQAGELGFWPQARASRGQTVQGGLWHRSSDSQRGRS